MKPISATTPETFPLTAAQRDIWLDQQRLGDSPLYNIGGYLELRGPLDAALLQRALECLLVEHEALRTRLLAVDAADGLPRQYFAAPGQVELPAYDFSRQAEPLAAAQALIQAQMEQAWALFDGPLLHFALVRVGTEHHLLAILVHHLIIDGWGLGQMLKSLGDGYNTLLRGQQPLGFAPAYRRFIHDDAEYQGSARHARDRDYWLQTFRQLPEPLLEPRRRERLGRSQMCAQAFPAELHQRMQALAGQWQASAFHVLLAALHVYFSRTGQRDEWVVGLPILNRAGARFKSTVGLFAQVSAVRMGFGRELSFAALVQAVRDTLRNDLRHQRFPLSELNRALGLLREERTQLFEVSLSYEQDDHDYQYGEAKARTVKLSNRHEPTPLAIHFRSDCQGAQACLYLVYSEAYFDAGEVEALGQRLLQVLEQGLAEPQRTPGEFELSLPAEVACLQRWNATRVAYAQGQTLHQRISRQALGQPQAIAAVCNGQTLSYAQLERRANALAQRLVTLGVGPEARVAIVAGRGLDALVGLLAILKAGGAYVPIDPAHPPQRLAYLLQDSAPLAVLVSTQVRARLPALEVPLLELGGLQEAAEAPQVAGQSARQLAYVIYTSGSTGLPKGVMVEHASLGNLVDWHCAAFDLKPGRHMSCLAGFGFDALGWEIWPALCAGATLHVLPDPPQTEALPGNQAIDIDAMLAWWCAQPLEVSFLPTPIAEYAFSQQLEHPTLRTLLVGGDRLRRFPRQPSFTIVNNYGPTEATVVASSGPVDSSTALHIGAPISNTCLYLLDSEQRPVPLGVTGELYIGGSGVARGYFNRPQLTAERFLADPFSPVADARLYRTGDLARWRADGHLDYQGRNDDQVKIRGQRIELGEIDAALSSHFAVKDAVAQVRDGLVIAWFSERDPLDIGQLHAHLKTRLPQAMLPAAYVRLVAMPLTANGKLDRKALPAPGPDDLLRRGYSAPQGDLEQRLAELWAELLHVERVGRDDHFFELGGHSLLAVSLIERMRQQGLRANVQVLFGQPTLASLAASVEQEDLQAVPANRIVPGCTRITPEMLPLVTLDQASIDRVVASVPGGGANVQDIYPLAPLQAGLLYHHLSERRDPYQQQALFAFTQREQFEAFATALQQVIERHDILRTGLCWEGLETPLQVVWRQARLPVERLLLNGDEAVASRLRAHADAHPLDIRQAPLLALSGAEDPAQQRWLGLLRFHHLVNDAASTGLLLGEIAALLGGQPLPPSVPYRNYVAQVGKVDHSAFFQAQLGDFSEPSLAFELAPRAADEAPPEEARELLDPLLTQRLRTQARQLDISPASLFHLAWAQVLGALSGAEDVVFGSVLVGRLQAGAGAERALGMFINTLPLRADLRGRSVLAAVGEVQARLAALLAHEHAPLALAQRCSAVSAGVPLFNSLLNYRHAQALDDPALLRGLPGCELLSATEIVSYPLMIAVDDLPSGLRLSAKAPHSVGARRLLEYLSATLQGLVAALEHTPQRPLQEISVLPAAERRQLLVEYNATEVDCVLDQPYQALFEAQVRRTPQAVAVQAGAQQMSYEQLNRAANRLAHHLRALGVGPDDRVALCVERGLELVIGLLAILKAGGAYVPLDPSYPTERLEYMLLDSAPVVLLVHGATRGLFANHGLRRVEFEQADWQLQPDSNPQVPGLNARHLAYMIYTSGSTGTPKGVMLEHRGLCNLMHWGSQICPPQAAGALLQKAPFSFDGSVWELFWPLSAGLRLVLARPDGHLDPAYLVQLINAQQVSVVKFVPALLQQFLAEEGVEWCRSLTDLFCGGGELTAALAHSVRQRLPWVRLHNVYGPTEATVDSTAFTLEPHMPLPSGQLPIGRAIGNTRLYLLDAQERLVPRGVAGQLYIGGVGVARGYLGLPGLMAERFIDSPFVPGDRLYRTGDLARYRADGNLEFLGRNDFQVKLRGLRLEPGEIEARLLAHAQVREAVVLVHGDQLLAYYSAHIPIDSETLRDWLRASLPEYMVPAAFIALAALPLSPNGKVERKALPTPDLQSLSQRRYAAPEGAVEQALASIWAELLTLERVGRHDHFFELGGHSLLAVTLVARMRQAGLHADARTLFSQPTLAALAAQTREQARQVEIPATRIPSLAHKRRL